MLPLRTVDYFFVYGLSKEAEQVSKARKFCVYLLNGRVFVSLLSSALLLSLLLMFLVFSSVGPRQFGQRVRGENMAHGTAESLSSGRLHR